MHTFDGLCVMDSAQRIVAWNKGAERILGHTEAEVLHRPCYEVMRARLASGKLLCQPNCLVCRFVERGSLPQSVNALSRTREGTELWLNIATVILPRKRNPLTMHLLRDITCDEHVRQATEEIVRALRSFGVLQLNEDRKPVVKRASLAPPPACPLSILTRRELEVLRLLAEGLSSQAIADRLEISLFTIRNHVQNILNKLAVGNKAQAVAYAFRSGLF